MNSPESQFSLILITLLKGVIYRDSDPPIWQGLLEQQARVRDHISVLGLELILDEVEGCAHVRQREPAEGEPELPRLVPRRQLSYPVSLLLALLRKRLVELDASGGETRLILSRDNIVEALRTFLPQSGNEARLIDRINIHINKIVDMGFLRLLRGQAGQYEVRRILKAYVDAQWLSEFDQKLEAYRLHAASISPLEEPEIS